mmetsp:Transcript_55242/g.103623  ORF Transcript_55242/g.103623 Transcript_55242/m.103623 type:complete len:247 (-) Transcript_55242:331-1071(-)
MSGETPDKKARERVKRLTRQHDIVTVFPIGGLFLATVFIYLTRDVSADEAAQREHPGVHPDPVYLLLVNCAGVYAAFDIIYIIVEPSVTKRYWQMMLHHAATLIMVYVAHAGDSECMALGPLLVELNTLILTAQKLFKIKWLMTPMLITWFALRLVWYPVLTYISFVYFSHPRFDAVRAHTQRTLLTCLFACMVDLFFFRVFSMPASISNGCGTRYPRPLSLPRAVSFGYKQAALLCLTVLTSSGR